MPISSKTTSAPEKFVGLSVRRLADKTNDDGSRITVKGKDGKMRVVDKGTGKPKPWPSRGWIIQNYIWDESNQKRVPHIPPRVGIPMKSLNKWREMGFATVEGERPVHSPGGNKENPWKITHTFIHVDVIVLHTLEGDVRYKVVRQPGKYNLDTNEPTHVEALKDGAKSVVYWDYKCELEN
jgi:hypothetical protein